jgi:trans-aconitate methyltransferase
MDELTMLGIKYNCDKSYFHNYTPFYEKFFKTFKNNDINILEIGVNYGASLLMMKDYFPNAHIYAIDIDPNTIKNYHERIHTYQCSQDNSNRINKLFKNIKFDIIIDDGSHQTLHQLQSFGFLFKKLKSNGIYICEDIHTSKNKNFITSKTTPLEMFENYLTTNKIDIPEINKYEQDYLNKTIKSLDIYKRSVNAYKCYNCGVINNHKFTNCSKCNIDLSPNDLSCSALLIKK